MHIITCYTKKAMNSRAENGKDTSALRKIQVRVVALPEPPVIMARLQKTRSGRHVIPPLAWWTGQRVVVDPKNNSVGVFPGAPNTQCAAVMSDNKTADSHISLARKTLAGKTQTWKRDIPKATCAATKRKILTEKRQTRNGNTPRTTHAAIKRTRGTSRTRGRIPSARTILAGKMQTRKRDIPGATDAATKRKRGRPRKCSRVPTARQILAGKTQRWKI